MKTRTLIGSKLVALLYEARNGRMISDHTWNDTYVRFCSMVTRLTNKPCSSEMIRLLERTRIELSDLSQCLEHNSASDAAVSYCHKARAVVESELRLIDLRLKYPDLDSEQSAVPRSPLYLNKDTTVSDIVELIAPIHKLNLLRTDTGRAKLQTIISGFEWLLNIDLTNYAGLRCAIFKRQDLTSLLDKLRNVWIEASQK